MTLRGHRDGLRARLEASLQRPGSDYLLVAVLSALAVGLISLRLDFKTIGTAAFADPGWDRHLYREMARRDPFDFHIAPYCWRILIPALARLNPWSLQSGFLTVALGCALATGPALYWLVRGVGGSKSSAAIMVVLFYSLGWSARFALSDFWVPDAASMFVTTLAMALIVRKLWWQAAVALAVGVLVKESVIFVAPLAFSWHARGLLDWRALRLAVAVTLPAVVVLGGTRLLIEQRNDDAAYIATMPPQISRFPELYRDYNYGDRYRTIVKEDRWPHRELKDFDRYIFDPLGLPLLVLAVVGGSLDPTRALRLLPFLLLVYAQLLFATDTQRLIVLAAPALAVLAASAANHVAAWRRGEVVLAAAALFVFLATLWDANSFGAQSKVEAAVLVFAAAALMLADPKEFSRRARQGWPLRR